MFMSVEYVVDFVNEQHKRNKKVSVYVFNGQTSIRYNDDYSCVPVYHPVNNGTDEHTILSWIAYYTGMGYKITRFHRKRITSMSYEERQLLERKDKERCERKER